MILKNKYTFHLLSQWYEIMMLSEHIDSCIQMLENVTNMNDVGINENVIFHLQFSIQEHLEQCCGGLQYLEDIRKVFQREAKRLEEKTNCIVLVEYIEHSSPFYNIAEARRDLNDRYCTEADIIVWGECDSLYPKQTLYLLEALHENVKEKTPKYIVNFSDRKLWDNSFAPCHPMFENAIINNELEDEASGKSYMSLERMNEINDIPLEDVIVDVFNEPRFDGSCVAFSSELLKSGVNIPRSLILTGEDTSIGIIAKKLLGDNFVQYNFRNILHVHNRRHPNKRTGILNESNPNGFCDDRKGGWWKDLEVKSKFNLNHLFNQVKFQQR